MAVAPSRPPLPARDYPPYNTEIKQVANDFKVIKDFKDFKETKNAVLSYSVFYQAMSDYASKAKRL